MHYNSPAMNSWLGYAFEEIVFYHIEQVKSALGISGVCSNESAWSVDGTDTQEGMQIDLLIERADRVVNICEIKFCNDEYAVTSAYARKTSVQDGLHINLLQEQEKRFHGIDNDLWIEKKRVFQQIPKGHNFGGPFQIECTKMRLQYKK